MGNLDEDYGITSFVVKYKTFGCVLTSSSLNLTTINLKKTSYSTIIAFSNTQDTLQEENGIEDGVAASSRKPE